MTVFGKAKCRYVFTPMLSGLRWPGQTIMGSWQTVVSPAVKIWNRSFTSVQMFHTHTPLGGVKTEVPTVRWRWGWQEMKVKWAWQWDESYLTRTQDGERTKRRGGTKRKHRHQHTWPGAGEPWKGKGKEKAEADGSKPRQEEGREDGSAWTNLNPSENKTYLSTHGTEPTWNGGARMK